MTKTNVQPIPSNSQRHDTPNNKTHVIQNVSLHFPRTRSTPERDALKYFKMI